MDEIILTKDIQKGLEIYSDTRSAVLIDVRTPAEYAEGHIPGSVNMPLTTLENDVYDAALDYDTPLFCYCLTGNRSIQAATALREIGYECAVSIGGIDHYKGDVER